MSDDLDLRCIASRHEPNPQFRAALQRRLTAIVDGADPDVVIEMRDLVTVDLEPTSVPLPPSRNRRLVAQVILAAAAVVVIALVASRDDDVQTPADQPSPTVTVPPTTPPRALASAVSDPELLAPGTYFLDEVAGTATPWIFVTIGAGWTTHGDDLFVAGRPGRRPEDDVGVITFSRPDRVYLDACHLTDGFHPGPVTTVDGLVTAFMEQQGGWVDVTAPSDISIDGYQGKTFQRTAPAVFSDCSDTTSGRRDRDAAPGVLQSWLNEDEEDRTGRYYEPGQQETVMVLDIDGTVIVINANLWAGSTAAERAEFDAVLDSIRIDPRPLPNGSGSANPLAPGTYYADSVDGTPTPRIFATIGEGWRNSSEGWFMMKGDAEIDISNFDEFLQHEIGYMWVSKPVAVYSDACHWEDGYHPGPVDTVDGLVTALTVQQGWASLTTPSDLSVDGYVGKAFQRTALADMSDCSTRSANSRVSMVSVAVPDIRSWDDVYSWGGIYEPGQIETLWVLDLDGTIVVISTGVWPEPSAGADADFATDVLASIRIGRP